MTADGYISKNEEAGSGTVGLELKYADLEHVKKFHKALDSNYRIVERWRPCRLAKDPNKLNQMATTRIYSLKMYEDLVNLGFTSNKTFDAYIPNLREDLIRHFIRAILMAMGAFVLQTHLFL